MNSDELIDDRLEEGTGQTVVSGVAVSSVTSMVLRALDVATGILLLRWLTIFEYGLYQLVTAAYDFFTGFFLSGLENVVVSDASRDLKKDLGHARNIFSTYVVCMAIVGILLWALFFYGSGLLTRWVRGGDIIGYIKIISFIFLLAPFESAYKLTFQIFLDFWWANFFRIIGSATRIAVVVSYFFFFSFHVREALISLLAATALPTVVAFLCYRRQTLFRIPSYEGLRTSLSELFLKHGKWAIASDFINNLPQTIQPFIVKIFAGVEAVALISLAQSLIGTLKSLFPIREILTPILPRSGDDPTRLARQINRATKYATAVYGVLAISAAVGVPYMVFLLFPKYLPALPLFYILLLGFPWWGFRLVAVPVFYTLKEQRTLLVVTTGRTVVSLMITVVATYLFGVWGAVVGMVCIGILTSPAYALAIKRILPEWKFSWKEFFSFDEYDRVVMRTIVKRVLVKTGWPLS